MVKIALLMLVVISVLALFGRLRFPRLGRRATCDHCGRPRIGRGPCDCDKGRG